MRLTILTLIFVWRISLSASKICQSIDVRNSLSDLNQLRNCTVILGKLHVVLIDKANATEWLKYSFPHLTEITDHLVFYRVRNITTLSHLFPNLSVIRGHNLIFNYALAIFDVELFEVGLVKLTKILRGAVMIEKNRDLCYARTIDWRLIAPASGHLIHEKYRKSCPSRGVCNCTRPLCWNPTACQILPTALHECHSLCLGGCRRPNDASACSSCREFRDGDTCVKNCPPDKFVYDEYFCVSEKDCLDRKRIPFQQQCTARCPFSFRAVSPAEGYCEKCVDTVCHVTCDAEVALTNVASIERLRGCTIISGSLRIRLLTKRFLISALYKNLNSVQEIIGGLTVTRSYMESLDFLKNLRVIHGKDRTYAFNIAENPNLIMIFNLTHRAQSLKVRNGKLYFQYNPRLCLEEIEKLRKYVGIQKEMENTDVSPVFNGNQVVCGYGGINSTIVVLNSSSVFIEWNPFTPPKTHVLLGYWVHYSVAPKQDVVQHHFATDCQDRSWEIENLILQKHPDQPLQIILVELLPYTQYGYYITAFLSEVYSKFKVRGNIGGQSKIQYFTTKPDKPSQPREVRMQNIGHSQILVTWKPPLELNGVIQKYVVVAYLQQYELKHIEERNYCLNPKKDRPVTTAKPMPLTATNTCSNGTCRKDIGEIMGFLMDPYNPKNIIQVHLKSLDLVQGDKTTVPKFYIPSTEKVKDHYSVYVKEVPGNVLALNVTNLLQYSMYMFHVAACNKDVDGVEFCSTVAMESTRSGAKLDADAIPRLLYSHDDDYLYWSEPPMPNCIILTYTLQVFRADTKELVKDVCVTRRMHQQAGFKYDLSDLPYNSYYIKIRANSLAMHGPWFRDYRFKKVNFLLWVFVAITPLILVAILVAAVFLSSRFRNWLLCTAEVRDYVSSGSSSPEFTDDDTEGYEICRDDVRLIETRYELRKAIGAQHYALVHKGRLADKPCYFIISTKALDSKKEKEQFLNEFIKDFFPFKDFNATHVLRILGVVTKQLPYIIAIEGASEGLLSDYLQYLASIREKPCAGYMLKWAAEISDGMAYFSEHKQAHRDLATRNIFLTSRFTIKISCVGIGRGKFPEDYYIINQRAYPVRWMPKEALQTKKFSVASDVWSYGVVLWEIASCGKPRRPYDNLSNVEAYRFICHGGSLVAPTGMPEVLRYIMEMCFRAEERRPQFRQIALLGLSPERNFRQVAYVLSADKDIPAGELATARVAYRKPKPDLDAIEVLASSSGAVSFQRVNKPIILPARYIKEMFDTKIKKKLRNRYDLSDDDDDGTDETTSGSSPTESTLKFLEEPSTSSLPHTCFSFPSTSARNTRVKFSAQSPISTDIISLHQEPLSPQRTMEPTTPSQITPTGETSTASTPPRLHVTTSPSSELTQISITPPRIPPPQTPPRKNLNESSPPQLHFD